MARLQLTGLTKTYGDFHAVAGVDLDIWQGELVMLLGPSGCGKTTTLRMIAGFIAPTAGRIRLGGKDITMLPPWKRDTGMVFQSYALFRISAWRKTWPSDSRCGRSRPPIFRSASPRRCGAFVWKASPIGCRVSFPAVSNNAL